MALVDLSAVPDVLPQVMSIRGGRTFSPTSVTVLGAVVNVLLSLLKLVVGTASGSASLVADAYHSASDLLVDAVTMVAVHAPPSFERAATFVIAGILASAGATMSWTALASLWRRSVSSTVLGTPPLLVAVVAISAKEFLFRLTLSVGRRTHQAVLLASAKHHRSDAMSSLAAAIGSAGVLAGVPALDTLAAAVVGGMMISMGVGVARGEDH
jgi:divalent metal cation (Fe/Co/Zn/Cd) transporter